MPRIKRTNFTADRQIQTQTSRRLVIYWCVTWLAVFVLPILVRTLTTSIPFSQLATSMINDLWFPMAMSFLILPILAWDHYRFMHRITGPVRRIGQSLQTLADNKPVTNIRLRKEDFCQQLADDFNRLNSSLEKREMHAQDRLEREEVMC